MKLSDRLYSSDMNSFKRSLKRLSKFLQKEFDHFWEDFKEGKVKC